MVSPFTIGSDSNAWFCQGTLYLWGVDNVDIYSGTYPEGSNEYGAIEVLAGLITIEAGDNSGGGSGDTSTITITDADITLDADDDITLRVDDKLYFEGLSAGSGTDLVISGTSVLSKSSSKRYKKDIKYLKEDIDWIHDLRPVSFRYKTEERISHGLIAEDVIDIAPDFVFLDKEGRADGIAYSELVPILIKTIQLQNKQIQEITKTLDKIVKK